VQIAAIPFQPRWPANLGSTLRLSLPSEWQRWRNQDRPDKAFTSERAKKAGKANASSGKIFVTVPPDHLGPILAENDPERNQGVLVGESWEGRLECRQWGIHLPPVSGIAGQSSYGAQSVVLSGGYEDDEDHGEWFLYTGRYILVCTIDVHTWVLPLLSVWLAFHCIFILNVRQIPQFNKFLAYMWRYHLVVWDKDFVQCIFGHRIGSLSHINWNWMVKLGCAFFVSGLLLIS